MIKMKDRKACTELIDLYDSYTECKDKDFRLWNENDDDVSFEKMGDGDFRISIGGTHPTYPGYLSDFRNPLKTLKNFRIVQVTTVFSKGKVVPIKKQK